MYLQQVGPHERIDRRLIALRVLGFQFGVRRDSSGAVVALAGCRAHHGVIDIVQFYGEHDVAATRIPDDEPDILFPRTTIWRATGRATDVIDTLLTLADPVLEEARTPRRNTS